MPTRQEQDGVLCPHCRDVVDDLIDHRCAGTHLEDRVTQLETELKLMARRLQEYALRLAMAERTLKRSR